MTLMEQRSRNIQSVERAMLILEMIKSYKDGARLSELAEASGLSKSTVHGLLDTLVSMGYVTRNQTRYSLGLRLRLLSQPPEEAEEELRKAFAPALRAFMELSGENCFLAVPCGTRSYLTIDALDRQGAPLYLPANEQREALITSAIGKVFIANDSQLAYRLRREMWFSSELEQDLKQVTNQGYALDMGASEQDLNCVALPLRIRGKVVAALGAGGPSDRLEASLMRRLATKAMRDLFDLIKC